MQRSSNRGYDVLHDLVNSGQLVADYENHTLGIQNKDQPLQLAGAGNFGPRQDFADKLYEMDDETFERECENYIWLAAYAANNPISDYHWQCDACYHEATRRGKPEIYNTAWHNASGM